MARSSAAFPAASRASSLSPYAARCFLCSSAYARWPSCSRLTCRRTQACRRRMHSLLSRAAHLCARCWLFLAHVTPMRPPPLRPSVVPRSAHGPRFHKRRKKPQASKKFLCLTLFSFARSPSAPPTHTCAVHQLVPLDAARAHSTNKMCTHLSRHGVHTQQGAACRDAGAGGITATKCVSE